MLDWLWKSKGSNSESSKSPPKDVENKADLGFLDPSLKEHYETSKPLTPISLAPKDLQEQYEKEAQKIKEAQESASTVQQQQPGMYQIEENEHTAGTPLGQVARNNCVEYEALLADCSLKGTYWERLNMCHIYRKQQMKCVELQSAALEMLGYSRAATEAQRKSIQYKCDDLFSEHVPDGPITDEVATRFEKAVEKERARTEVYRY